MKKSIQGQADELADCCLLEANVHHKYTEKDFVNASIIFMHFFIDILYTSNQHLTLDEQSKLASTTGTALRQLILDSTGKDMHELVINLNENTSSESKV